MSTFDGKVAEFPDVRIDYFRPDHDSDSSNSRPALAYFLSHIHSDHLVGLETCHSPFVYCTPATRDILLRLEKYPHRMNFARGILETRKQTFRHLKLLLKAIPLETPTCIELAPGRDVRVTLFDANHCVGACMFLIEGDGKAVLYTGDVRSEVWWVNSLVRNPILIPYIYPTNGEPMKRLDCIYLDTTFVVTGKEDQLRDFASKAQGIDELLRKVAQYPSGTNFYLDAWTFGYEDVWRALSNALGSQVHVDEYKYKLYAALNNGIEPKAPEGRQMIGFPFANLKRYQQGCLTEEHSRLHSCERGTGCEIWDKDYVRITPIVTRYQGNEIAELGAGGGQHDLNQRHELQFWNSEDVGKLMAFCTTKLESQPQLLSGILQLLASVVGDNFGPLKLESVTSAAQPDDNSLSDLDDLPLENLVPALAKLVTNKNLAKNQSNGVNGRSAANSTRADGLPKQITFPYSRHSSYNELCLLVEAFKPRDVFPCTVDEKDWSPDSSMQALFGHIYQVTPTFRHDEFMFGKHKPIEEPKIAGSRPGSAGTSSTAYATPGEDIPDSRNDVHQMERAKKRNSDEQSVSDSDSKRRKRAGRDAQGDFWPPLEVDHYSTRDMQGDHWPPPEVDHYSTTRARNARHKGASRKFPDQGVDSTSRPSDLEYVKDARKSPVSYRGQFLLSQPKPDEEFVRSSYVYRKERRHKQCSSYGRLSPQYDPPPANITKAKAIVEEGPLEKPLPPPQRTLAYGRLSPSSTAGALEHNHDKSPAPSDGSRSPLSRLRRDPSSADKVAAHLSPAASRRLAFRQEVYDAVRSNDGVSWSEIGLVSVGGHQTEEEEL